MHKTSVWDCRDCRISRNCDRFVHRHRRRQQHGHDLVQNRQAAADHQQLFLVQVSESKREREGEECGNQTGAFVLLAPASNQGMPVSNYPCSGLI